MRSAKQWLTGSIYKGVPGSTVRCQVCGEEIPAGGEAFRYITGLYRGRAEEAFACSECGRELLEYIVADASEKLA